MGSCIKIIPKTVWTFVTNMCCNRPIAREFLNCIASILVVFIFVTTSLLAEDVKKVIGNDINIVNTKSDDNRSYHVSSEKIKEMLGFETKYTIKDAVLDLKNAFEKKDLLNTFNDEFFFNIKRMQSINLK